MKRPSANQAPRHFFPIGMHTGCTSLDATMNVGRNVPQIFFFMSQTFSPNQYCIKSLSIQHCSNVYTCVVGHHCCLHLILSSCNNLKSFSIVPVSILACSMRPHCCLNLIVSLLKSKTHSALQQIHYLRVWKHCCLYLALSSLNISSSFNSLSLYNNSYFLTNQKLLFHLVKLM